VSPCHYCGRATAQPPVLSACVRGTYLPACCASCALYGAEFWRRLPLAQASAGELAAMVHYDDPIGDRAFDQDQWLEDCRALGIDPASVNPVPVRG
jgi:hypothetical protein